MASKTLNLCVLSLLLAFISEPGSNSEPGSTLVGQCVLAWSALLLHVHAQRWLVSRSIGVWLLCT